MAPAPRTWSLKIQATPKSRRPSPSTSDCGPSGFAVIQADVHGENAPSINVCPLQRPSSSRSGTPLTATRRNRFHRFWFPDWWISNLCSQISTSQQGHNLLQDSSMFLRLGQGQDHSIQLHGRTIIFFCGRFGRFGRSELTSLFWLVRMLS